MNIKEVLNWRYAAKDFDPNKKIEQHQILTLQTKRQNQDCQSKRFSPFYEYEISIKVNVKLNSFH